MTGEVGFWGNMLRFLVVDDSPNLATLIKTLLEGAFPDSEIRIAHTNKDADSLLASFVPTLIWTDINRSGGSGLEMIAKLKDDPRTRHIPVGGRPSSRVSGRRRRHPAAGHDDLPGGCPRRAGSGGRRTTAGSAWSCTAGTRRSAPPRTCQLTASMSNGRFLEYWHPAPYVSGILRTPLVLDEAGLLPVPDRPGLGIEIDLEAVRACGCGAEDFGG